MTNPSDQAPQVVTRFAPSPTGYLHIGGARTALFNWLYARANGGKFLLRIEDTDQERSTPEATAAIHDSMAWLGLAADETAISQFANRARHAEVAAEMLARGTAYKCFSTPDEIEAAREQSKAEGKGTLFQSPWRDVGADDHPDLPFVVRLKAPLTGDVQIKDKVQGKVKWSADAMDDLVLLRSDGTPTYMLAVVVDDHDMGVTHIIRGDDHLINAGRQLLIYLGMGWKPPVFAHIPLIHGDDGKKLSKRHGATGAEEYREMGYMAEAMRNYLARLGWSHGNDELFTTEQAIEWFDFKGMGKSPSRLDFKKLDSVSAHHIKTASDADLITALRQYINADDTVQLADAEIDLVAKNVSILRERCKRLPDILDKAAFLLAQRPLSMSDEASQALDSVSNGILKQLTTALTDASWTQDSLEQVVNDFTTAQDIKFGQIAKPMRAALTGRTASPSVFDMMVALGKTETLARLEDVI